MPCGAGRRRLHRPVQRQGVHRAQRRRRELRLRDHVAGQRRVSRPLPRTHTHTHTSVPAAVGSAEYAPA